MSQEDSIEYIETIVAAHNKFKVAKSYIPGLTGKQRELLANLGYVCGISSGGDCCWFSKRD
jgi:hypothetical protein